MSTLRKNDITGVSNSVTRITSTIMYMMRNSNREMNHCHRCNQWFNLKDVSCASVKLEDIECEQHKKFADIITFLVKNGLVYINFKFLLDFLQFRRCTYIRYTGPVMLYVQSSTGLCIGSKTNEVFLTSNRMTTLLIVYFLNVKMNQEPFEHFKQVIESSKYKYIIYVNYDLYSKLDKMSAIDTV